MGNPLPSHHLTVILRTYLGKSFLPKIHKNCPVDFIDFNRAVFVIFPKYVLEKTDFSKIISNLQFSIILKRIIKKLYWFCYIEKLIEWSNSWKAYKKQTFRLFFLSWHFLFHWLQTSFVIMLFIEKREVLNWKSINTSLISTNQKEKNMSKWWKLCDLYSCIIYSKTFQ